MPRGKGVGGGTTFMQRNTDVQMAVGWGGRGAIRAAGAAAHGSEAAAEGLLTHEEGSPFVQGFT